MIEKDGISIGLVENNRLAFQNFASFESQGHDIKGLTPEALYYLIPDRLFQLSNEPHNMRALNTASGLGYLGLYIVEKIPGYDRRHPQAQFAGDPYYQDMSDREEFLARTGIDIDEAIYLSAYLDNFHTNNAILEIQSIEIMPEMRRKRVGVSFYERLREIGSELGYLALLGEQSGGAIDVYKGKFNRLTLGEIRPHVIKDFKLLSVWHNRHITIEFLDPDFHRYARKV